MMRRLDTGANVIALITTFTMPISIENKGRISASQENGTKRKSKNSHVPRSTDRDGRSHINCKK